MRDIVTYGEEVLQKKAEPVTNFGAELEALARDMFEAMRHDKGIGLAAPQVGVSKRVFVTDVDGDKPRVFVNPEITMTSHEQVEYEEGCLSFPGLYFNVKRPASVTVSALNEKGKPFTLEASELLARVIQHENDHLDGILFVDRVTPLRKARALQHYGRLVKM